MREGAGWAGAAGAAGMSAALTAPPGPLPVMVDRSTPRSLARARAFGLEPPLVAAAPVAGAGPAVGPELAAVDPDPAAGPPPLRRGRLLPGRQDDRHGLPDRHVITHLRGDPREHARRGRLDLGDR